MRELWIHKEISRVQIAKNLDVDKSTVTSIVADLLRLGLVVETSEGRPDRWAGAGRCCSPEPLLRVRPGLRAAAGVLHRGGHRPAGQHPLLQVRARRPGGGRVPGRVPGNRRAGAGGAEARRVPLLGIGWACRGRPSENG